MPLPKRMERTPSSPVKIKQEPVDQEDTNVFEALRDVQEDADETIVISDDDYDPLVATYVHAPENQEEDGIVLHLDDGDLAIDELDYEPVERDRGESLLDEVLCKLTNSLLDNRRPFRMNRETNVKWFHEKMNEARKCNLYRILFIYFNLAIYYYTIYTDISKPFVAVDSLYMYIVF